MISNLEWIMKPTKELHEYLKTQIQIRRIVILCSEFSVNVRHSEINNLISNMQYKGSFKDSQVAELLYSVIYHGIPKIQWKERIECTLQLVTNGMLGGNNG